MTVTYDPKHPQYFDEADVRDEMTRVFDICHGCRLCFKFCTSFPSLFELVDRFDDQDAGRLTLVLTLTGEATGWNYSRGRAGREHLAGLLADDSVCFVCGPPSMVTEIPSALELLGVAADRIRTERW